MTNYYDENPYGIELDDENKKNPQPMGTTPLSTPQTQPMGTTPLLTPQTQQQTTVSTTSGYKPSQATLQKQQTSDASQQQVIKSTQEQVKAEQDYNDALLAQEIKTQEQIKKYNEQEQSRVDDENKKREAYINRITQAQDEYKSTRVDPNRLIGNNPILAAISIGLGGIGMGIAGKPGENPALDIINKQIDRDIRNQEQELLKKKDVIGEAKNDLSRFRELTGDDRVARLALHNAKLKETSQIVAEKAAASKNAEVKAKADQIIAGIQKEIAKNAQELEQLTQNKVVTQVTTTPLEKKEQKTEGYGDYQKAAMESQNTYDDITIHKDNPLVALQTFMLGNKLISQRTDINSENYQQMSEELLKMGFMQEYARKYGMDLDKVQQLAKKGGPGFGQFLMSVQKSIADDRYDKWSIAKTGKDPLEERRKMAAKRSENAQNVWEKIK